MLYRRGIYFLVVYSIFGQIINNQYSGKGGGRMAEKR